LRLEKVKKEKIDDICLTPVSGIWCLVLVFILLSCPFCPLKLLLSFGNFMGKIMEIVTESFNISTRGNSDIIDITRQVDQKISSNNFVEGNVLIFAGGSTAGITTIEYEPGLLRDYPLFMEKIIPSGDSYLHDQTWHDGNGHSHVRAALQGASLTVPFSNGNLLLGTWQQIVLIDFDNRARKRNIIVQITGKKKNDK
jgi:secondary thiamine-phosphate synthase enzyme